MGALMAYLAGFGDEGDHLRGLFESLWGARTPIAWSNKTFDPPNKAAWVRFNIRHSGAERIDLGTNPIRRHDGMVVVEVFVPVDDGEGALNAHCDRAAEIFRDSTGQTGLRFRSPYVRDVGREGGWYRRNVLIPFVRDTVFS